MTERDQQDDDRTQALELKHRIDTVSDRFEQEWTYSPAPAIADFISNWSGQDRLALLVELIMIDMDYRWRIDESGNSLPGTSELLAAPTGPDQIPPWPLIEDYARSFAELGFPRVPLEMICFEFQLRCKAGETPDLASYCERFEGHDQDVRQCLREQIEELFPCRILVTYGSETRFFSTLTTPLEVGRQRTKEPSPYRISDVTGKRRLIIARLTETTVSRRQILIDQASPTRLRITNQCGKNSIYLTTDDDPAPEILEPGEATTASVPVEISLEDRAVRIEPYGK